MSAPFTAFPIPTLTTKDWSLARGCIFLSDFGVVGDSVTDDTAALNAAFASVKGTGATVIWDTGFSKTTNTVFVGDATTGAAAPTSFINIISTRGNNKSGIFYYGPVNRPVLQFAVNKYFVCQGININNQAGSKGTSTGILLGGSSGVGTTFGTQCLAATFNNCNVVGFNVGIADGNFGAASEIMWNELSLINNDIGWISNDFNTLDHCFFVLNMSDNGIGLDSGAAEGYRVYGGSASSNGINFQIRSNARCTVSGYRSEGNAIFCRANGGGSITISDCPMLDVTPTGNCIDTVSGTFSSLTLSGCTITGWVTFSSVPNNLVMINNGVVPDPTSHLPFVVSDPTQTGHVTLLRNRDSFNFPALALQDFIGEIGAGGETSVFGFLSILFLNDTSTLVPNVPLPGVNVLPAPFGADYCAMQFVRQLSEAPTAKSNEPYNNTLVTNASTAAGNKVLHFASVPGWVVPGMYVNDQTGGNIPGFPPVTSVTSTTVTVNNAATGGGVANGSTIKFVSVFGQATPGQNLRVSGTFATSNSLAISFIRSFVGNTGGGQSQTVVATGGVFLPTDAGKRIKVPGKGNAGWTDWYGFCKEFTDSTHINVISAAGQGSPNFTAGSGGATIFIGADEPDAKYMVAGIVGNTATPEYYSVTNITTTGFTVHSSNATSTATITALIVR